MIVLIVLKKCLHKITSFMDLFVAHTLHLIAVAESERFYLIFCFTNSHLITPLLLLQFEFYCFRFFSLSLIFLSLAYMISECCAWASRVFISSRYTAMCIVVSGVFTQLVRRCGGKCENYYVKNAVNWLLIIVVYVQLDALSQW